MDPTKPIDPSGVLTGTGDRKPDDPGLARFGLDQTGAIVRFPA